MNPYFRTPPAVKNLLIANMLVFLAMSLLPVFHAFAERYFCLYWFGNGRFYPWQFITYMFLHADFRHLFFNMFTLWMFGRTFEYEVGTKRFLVYYFVCGVGAALMQLGVAWLTGEYGIVLLGASGAIYGLLLAFGIMHPNERMLIFPLPVPVKAIWTVIGFGVIELLLGATGLEQGVAHFAHIGGMFWGWLLLVYWKRKGKIYY